MKLPGKVAIITGAPLLIDGGILARFPAPR
jgi:hypothetical protein